MNGLKNKIEKLKKGLDEQSKVLKNFTEPGKNENKKNELGKNHKPASKN